MKKLVWYGKNNRDLKIEYNSGRPQDPGQGEVLVKVKAVGICGTDIHILQGAPLPVVNPPLVLGHEIAGQIAKVGKYVNNVREGDRVTVDAVVGCGSCEFCKSQNAQFCPQGFEAGITSDGGCQDYLVMPARNVYPIPPSITFEAAAALDTEVYNAVRKCHINPRDSVLVLGAGPIGLIACQVARFLGAGQITLADILQHRLNMANALGVAEDYVGVNGSEGKTITPILATQSFDVVIDCAGTPPSAEHAFQAARLGGRVLLYAVYEEKVKSFELNQVVLKDLVVFGAQSVRSDWEHVIDLVASGHLNLEDMITHRFPLEEGERAYDLVRRREESVVKAVLLV